MRDRGDRRKIKEGRLSREILHKSQNKLCEKAKNRNIPVDIFFERGIMASLAIHQNKALTRQSTPDDRLQRTAGWCKAAACADGMIPSELQAEPALLHGHK